jgi:hypothetical protein
MYLTRLITARGVVLGVSLLGATAVLTCRALTAGPVQGQPLYLAEPKQEAQKQEADEKAEEAARQQSVDNLKTLAIALQSYHDEHGQFPPAAVYSKDGKALLSWRVLLLPYLEQRRLFRQFKLDEPWDGPTNQKLLARMPKVYAVPGGKGKGTRATIYQVITGPETVFPSPNACRIADITDGRKNTLLIVEAADPVPWTKPADLSYDSKKPVPKLGGVSRKGCQAAYADGSVRLLKPTIKEATLRALITRNGGEVIHDN